MIRDGFIVLVLTYIKSHIVVKYASEKYNQLAN